MAQLLMEKLTFVPGGCQGQRPPASGGGELVSAVFEGLWQVFNPSKRVQIGLGDDAQRAAHGFQADFIRRCERRVMMTCQLKNGTGDF